MIPRRRGTTVHAVGRPFGVGERPGGGEPSDRSPSLSPSRAITRSSSCPPPRPSLRHPASPRDPLTLPVSPTCTPQCALRRDASRWQRHRLRESQGMLVPRIRTASPKSISLVEKKGEKGRKEKKKKRLGTYNCRTSAITVSALCPRSCR